MVGEAIRIEEKQEGLGFVLQILSFALLFPILYLLQGCHNSFVISTQNIEDFYIFSKTKDIPYSIFQIITKPLRKQLLRQSISQLICGSGF